MGVYESMGFELCQGFRADTNQTSGVASFDSSRTSTIARVHRFSSLIAAQIKEGNLVVSLTLLLLVRNDMYHKRVQHPSVLKMHAYYA